MILRADHLSYAYARRPALRDVSFSVKPGDRVALVGPNGAGKSTLLRLLCGALTPSSGAVLLNGRPLHRASLSARASSLAYVAPSAVFGAPLSVRRIIEIGRRVRPPRPGLIDDVIARFDLDDLTDTNAQLLSAGQRQRVSLARACAQLADAEEGVLLADEPTSAMDPRYTRLTFDVFDEISARGVAVVAAIHDLTGAVRFATAGVVLDAEGALIAADSSEDALSTDTLERAFGVDFIRAHTPAGVVVTTR